MHPDGSYGGAVPGPADKPVTVGEGTWKVEDSDELVLPDRALEMAEAEEGVLRVERPRSG